MYCLLNKQPWYVWEPCIICALALSGTLTTHDGEVLVRNHIAIVLWQGLKICLLFLLLLHARILDPNCFLWMTEQSQPCGGEKVVMVFRPSAPLSHCHVAHVKS